MVTPGVPITIAIWPDPAAIQYRLINDPNNDTPGSVSLCQVDTDGNPIPWGELMRGSGGGGHVTWLLKITDTSVTYVEVDDTDHFAPKNG
jgi:hypothetical protein